MIRKLSHESPAEWNRFVPAALLAYRNRVLSSTGFSPFFLPFGRAPRGTSGAVSLCDPSVFSFRSVNSVEASLSVDTVVDKELHPNRDSDLRFCETICFAEPSAYVSAISEENGSEIGSLVRTQPLASESGAVVIDLSMSSSQVQDVKELLIEFQDILTSVPGCTNTLCHETRLTTDAVIRAKPYPVPFAAREFVTQEINDLLSLGVIEPSHNPDCFPIVVVKKKDRSMRLCIDSQKLNAVTVFDAENIPRQEDLFNQLSHARILSSCDLCKAYWQVPLHSESRKYTAFQTPLGLMQWTDLKALSYLSAGSPKNTRPMKWALALQEFSFQVVHIPGSENVHTDVLSRLC
ncbi:polyprotein [Plakobranchus ocellatus]|uniref:Polyprotein n=1 Tax=Plakobranchus ocellatus TaxID=259542 RepID=A0AAV3YIV9_9GAST|nr:polyprotein [Plakobranchus ocellatus]